jgi:hypothetical protein
LLQFSNTNNVAPLILAKNKVLLNCGAQCQTYLNVYDNVQTNEADLMCQSCLGSQVYYNLQCLNACPDKHFNNGGVCFRCANGVCPGTVSNISTLAPIIAPIAGVGATAALLPLINRTPIDNKLVGYDKDRYSPWGRKEHRSSKVEESFRIWAIFTFLFFLLSMLAGIIGVCMCCPYLHDTSFHDFFYQKFL